MTSGAPKAARTTSRGRTYQIPWPGPDGVVTTKNYWSVTTIIDQGLPKPALKEWGMTTVAEFAVANYRAIAEMVKGVRMRTVKDEAGRTIVVVSDPDAIDGAVSWVRNAPYRERERAKNRGSAVHARIEAMILGKPLPPPPDELAGHIAGFDAFVRDFSPVFELSEATVFEPDEGYAGTLDWIATIAGRRLLGDTKTNEKKVYPDTALQMAAYANAKWIHLAPGRDEPLGQVDGAMVLRLPGDGTYEPVPVEVSDRIYYFFKVIREVFRWQSDVAESVLGEPLLGPDGVRFLWPETIEKEVGDAA